MPDITLSLPFLLSAVVAIVGLSAFIWKLHARVTVTERDVVSLNDKWRESATDRADLRVRVSEAEATGRLFVQESQYLRQAVEGLTRAVASQTEQSTRISEQLARMEEREKLRHGKP